jgi:hypothetical protein
VRRFRKVLSTAKPYYAGKTGPGDEMSDVFKQAAVPMEVSVLEAVAQFLANLGVDPVVAIAKLPGAFLVLQGQVMLQGPALAQAEFGAVMSSGQAALAAAIAKLKASQTPAA